MKFFVLLFSFILSGTAFADVLYGVSPFYFSRGHSITPLKEIARRIPEWKDLGVTVLWVQPFFPAAEPGQGYDVVDFFSVAPGYGSPADLKDLVQKAHRSGIKVILDLPLNHTSLEHPFAKDVALQGKASAHYEFYQHHADPNLPYARFFNEKTVGQSTFVYYFWESLVNLNYETQQVRSFAIDVVEYWIKNFDVDGYRFDAGWGPSSRWHSFYPEINKAVRALKPEAILLAEDLASNPDLADSGFNYSYDWATDDPDWLSKWSFQVGESHDETLFNNSDTAAAAKSFAESIVAAQVRAQIATVRYIENNDTGSFLQHHTLKQTMFAAAIQFLLPGTPLMFYGQSEGISYPQWNLPSIDPERSLKSYSPKLWQFYKNLIQRRQMLGEIKAITNVSVTGSQVTYTIQPQNAVVVLDFKKQAVVIDGQRLLP